MSAVGTMMNVPRRARSCGANAQNSIVIPAGVSIPPAAPCTARQATSAPSDGAAAHSAEARVKTAREPRKMRMTPNRSDAHPETGRATAIATRNAVSSIDAACAG